MQNLAFSLGHDHLVHHQSPDDLVGGKCNDDDHHPHIIIINNTTIIITITISIMIILNSIERLPSCVSPGLMRRVLLLRRELLSGR